MKLKLSRRRFLLSMMVALGLLLTPFSSSLWAAPYLTCDPVPAGSWDKIEMIWDGGIPVLVDPKVNPDTTLFLYYDLTAITVGNHKVDLRSKKGEFYSSSVSFSFTRPAVSAPAAIKITP